MQNKKNVICAFLALILCGCQPAVSSAPVSHTEEMTEEAKGPDTSNAVPAEKKEESVYVETDASGLVKKITDTVKLTASPDSPVKDKTTLSDIRNTSGDEEYVLTDDGLIVFENKGNEITYKGTASGQLPVGVSVSYYLDEKKTDPSQLAGRSGHLKIRIDYQNYTGENYIPFLFVSAAVLDPDIFSNPKVTNGTLIEMDGMTAAAGYGIPGIKDFMHFSSHEMTEEIEIADYMEIEADVKEFELSFISTAVTSGLFSEIEDEDLKKGDDLISDMNELGEASGKIADGAEQLSDGASQFSEGLSQYVDGVNTLADGFGTLSGALGQLDENGTKLKDGASQISDALNGIKEKTDSFNKDQILSALSPEEKQKTEDAVQTALQDAQTITDILKDSSADMQEIQDFLANAESYETMVKDAAASITQSLQNIASADIQSSVVRSSSARSAISEEDLAAMDETVRNKVTELMSAAEELENGTGSVMGEIATISEQLKGLSSLQLPDIDIDIDALTPAVSDLLTQTDYLSKTAEKLGYTTEDFSDLVSAAQQLKSALDSLASGSQSLTDGIGQYTGAVHTLSQNISSAAEHTGDLKDGGSALKDGYSQLEEGIGSLAEGIREFDEKGIKELTKFADQDLRSLLKDLRSLIRNDSYDTYTGLFSETEGSVSFLFETEEIKAK